MRKAHGSFDRKLARLRIAVWPMYCRAGLDRIGVSQDLEKDLIEPILYCFPAFAAFADGFRERYAVFIPNPPPSTVL